MLREHSSRRQPGISERGELGGQVVPPAKAGKLVFHLKKVLHISHMNGRVAAFRQRAQTPASDGRGSGDLGVVEAVHPQATIAQPLDLATSTSDSRRMSDFSDLSAVFVNCTLKRSPEPSNTDALASISRAIMESNGVAVETVRAIDFEIGTGIYPDMTEHGWERDDWPGIFDRVMAADILVLLSPIWLGEKSSICTQVIERLYGNSHLLNDAGQYAYYGRVGGCLITGNEDGAKHCAMNILYSLQHLGFTIPPQADAGWMGEAGPGPSYLDPGSGGPENDFTNRNTTFMTWNLLHMARLLKDAGGIPAHGNQRSEWDAGCRFDFPNPDYR